MAAKIDINKCNGCGICQDICVECGACANQCPNDAILI